MSDNRLKRYRRILMYRGAAKTSLPSTEVDETLGEGPWLSEVGSCKSEIVLGYFGAHLVDRSVFGIGMRILLMPSALIV